MEFERIYNQSVPHELVARATLNEVIDDINDIGKFPSTLALAHYLQERGIKGRMGCATGCVLANYIRQCMSLRHPGVDWVVEVASQTVMFRVTRFYTYAESAPDVWYPSDWAEGHRLQAIGNQFISQFDRDWYPELVEAPEPEMAFA